MPSVASDPSSILPPPMRGNAPARANPSVDRDDATPFSDHLDSAGSAPPRDDRPTERSVSGSAPSSTTKSADTPDKSSKSAKTADANKASAKDNAKPDAKVSAPASDNPAAGDAKAVDADTTAQLIDAVAVVTQPAAATATATSQDAKPEDGKGDTDKSAGKAGDKAADAATADTAVAAADTTPQIKATDAAVIAVTVAPAVDAKPAPKTSVPQIPRTITATGKAAAKAAPQLDDDAAPQGTGDADGKVAAGAPDVKKADSEKTEAASQTSTQIAPPRLEKFDAVLAGSSDTRADPALTPRGADPAPQTVQVTPAHQAATAAPLTAAASSPTAAIPLGSLAVEIAGKAFENKHRFEIRLDPPELGRIDVRLDVDRNGEVTSRLTVDRPETLDLLRRDSANLERALQDAGLKTADNGLQFSLRDQGFNRNDQAASLPDSARLIARDDTLPAIFEATPRYRRPTGSAGGVDIRV